MSINTQFPLLDLNRKYIFGAGLLGGIGFTLSIFITNLAFTGNLLELSSSKKAVPLAPLIAGSLVFLANFFRRDGRCGRKSGRDGF